MEEEEIRIERIQFDRIRERSIYHGKPCDECDHAAEFEYSLWYNNTEEDAEPDGGILCGACAAVILLQETANDRVSLEKHGPVVRAIR